MNAVLCQTPRTVLRAVGGADLGPLYALATMPEIARMLFLFSPGMDRALFARQFPRATLTPPFRAVIEYGGQVSGSIGVGEGGAPPIYYFLSPAVAGRGLGTEVVGAFCDELGRRFGLDVLTAEVFADNPASRRVLERNGFAVTAERVILSAARPAPAPALVMRRG